MMQQALPSKVTANITCKSARPNKGPTELLEYGFLTFSGQHPPDKHWKNNIKSETQLKTTHKSKLSPIHSLTSQTCSKCSHKPRQWIDLLEKNISNQASLNQTTIHELKTKKYLFSKAHEQGACYVYHKSPRKSNRKPFSKTLLYVEKTK